MRSEATCEQIPRAIFYSRSHSPCGRRPGSRAGRLGGRRCGHGAGHFGLAGRAELLRRGRYRLTQGRSRGIAYSTAVYSLDEESAAPAAEPWKRWSPFEASFIEENLKALKPGEVKFRPIEDELTLRFVRLISVTGKKYYFESLLLQKLSTEDFLRTVKKVPCRINDPELRDWTHSINGNPILAPAEIAR